MKTSSVEIAILDVLPDQNSHLTAHEVYESIHQRLPAVNPSTVYRALERLAQAGKVSISDMGTGAAVYERVVSGMHHHLVCQGCGHTVTLAHEDVAAFFGKIQQEHSFQVITNHLILYGLCEVCLRDK